MRLEFHSGRNAPRLTVGIVALLLGISFAACGGDDSTSTEGSTPSEPTSQNAGSGSKQKGQSKNNRDKSEKTAKLKGSSSQSSEPTAKPVKPVPLRVSGGGSEQFHAKGGDNSIQEYGEESDESELEKAAEAVHGFYGARAEQDWEAACTYLAVSMVGGLERLSGQSPTLKGKGCAPILEAFTRLLPASVMRETTVVDAISLRREDDRGFLLYYDAEKTPYAMPLKDEEGTWKVTLLAATPIG